MATSWADSVDSERGSDELYKLYELFKLSSKKSDKKAFQNALYAEFPEDEDRKEAGNKIAKRYEEARAAEKVAAEKAIAEAKAAEKAKKDFPGVTITSTWTAKDGSWRADVVVKGKSYHIKLFLDGKFQIFDENQELVAVGNKLPENTGFTKLHGLTFKDGKETQVNWNKKLTQLQVATSAILEINTQPVLARVPISSAPVKTFAPTQEPSPAEASGKAPAPTAAITISARAPWKPVVTQAPALTPVTVTSAPSKSSFDKLEKLKAQKAAIIAELEKAQTEAETQLQAEIQSAQVELALKLEALAKLRT